MDMAKEKCNILLAEDDEDDFFFMQRAFNRAALPVAVQRVADGEEAICYLAGERGYSDRQKHPLPQIAILDIKMPRKTGFEVLTWIWQHPEIKRLVVLVLSSSNQARDVNLAYELGANSFIVKSAEFDRLTMMIHTLLEYWFTICERPEMV